MAPRFTGSGADPIDLLPQAVCLRAIGLAAVSAQGELTLVGPLTVLTAAVGRDRALHQSTADRTAAALRCRD